MYLIIRTSDQMITGTSDRLINVKSLDGEYTTIIPDEAYSDDMVGAIWVGGTHNIYIPQPTLFHKWDGNDWVDARPVEVKWSHIRSRRNEALMETDWTQVADNQLKAKQKTAYAKWRQTLRDLPNDYPDPDLAEEHLETILDAEPADLLADGQRRRRA